MRGDLPIPPGTRDRTPRRFDRVLALARIELSEDFLPCDRLVSRCLTLKVPHVVLCNRIPVDLSAVCAMTNQVSVLGTISTLFPTPSNHRIPYLADLGFRQISFLVWQTFLFIDDRVLQMTIELFYQELFRYHCLMLLWWKSVHC